ncbi:hypothetical protein CASFOL_004990 [Castilleja foliolosa]|uniref:Uncharacterized protein n=1 Tax=Castilleja foliolosa TaxID=1961234 RepID=A0ABD3E3H6_9LAMI
MGSQQTCMAEWSSQPQPRSQHFNEVNPSVSQPVSVRTGQNMGFSGNRFSLPGNTEVNGSRGFVPNYDESGGLNRNKAQDWSLQNVGSSFGGQQQYVQQGRVASVNRVGFSFGNTGNVGQQVNSSLGDNQLRNNKVVTMNNTGFQNGLLLEQFGQEQQQGVGPIENDYGYHLDNLPA